MSFDTGRKRTGTIYSKDKVKKKITIEDFKILKVLGRGAFGKVMLVQKKDNKELFALKSLRKAQIIDQEQTEHIKTERNILAKAIHPFLVNMAYSFQTPEKIFFAMEFMR